MKHAFRNIGLICIVMFVIPLISSSPLQLDQQHRQKSITQTTSVSLKLDVEIFNPSNWIVRGGYWDFSDKVFYSQGYLTGDIAYYKKQNYKNFTYEVKVMKVAEDGPPGILFRYNEATDEGYAFAFFPHGGCFLAKRTGQDFEYLKSWITAHFNEEMNTWNTLKVVAVGAKIDCFINGNFLESITEHSFSSGKVGLWNSNDPRQITKFEILSLFEH